MPVPYIESVWKTMNQPQPMLAGESQDDSHEDCSNETETVKDALVECGTQSLCNSMDKPIHESIHSTMSFNAECAASDRYYETRNHLLQDDRFCSAPDLDSLKFTATSSLSIYKSPKPLHESLWRSQTSQPQELSQTQSSEILTQNLELTQLADDYVDNNLSPLPPYSPAHIQHIPWGRLLPCSTTSQSRLDMLPRGPISDSDRSCSTTIARPYAGVSLLGLNNLNPSDIFNEYTIGRSNKCDLTVLKPPTFHSERGIESACIEEEQRNTAYGMVSNLHCRIYCALVDPKTVATSGPLGMAVYVEDCSGNGTLVNKTTLLSRGEKRILHSGDEISLVSAQKLQKKIRSTQAVNDLTQYFSFIFVNCRITNSDFQQPQRRGVAAIPSAISSLLVSTPFSVKKRKAAVDVRSTKHPRSNSQLNGNIKDAMHNTNGDVSFPQPAPRSPRQPQLRTVLSEKEPCPPSTYENEQTKHRNSKLRTIQEDYEIRDMLGSGTVGNVHRAIHRKTGKEFAVKIIQFARSRKMNFFPAAVPSGRNTDNIGFDYGAFPDQFHAEAMILRGLEHPYIVQLVDVYVTPEVAVYIVIELVQGGDLFDRIVEKGRYNEIDSRRVMRRLLSALYYLHEEQNIVHRDLKPENILCVSHSNDVEIKITDFGLAKSVSGNEDGLKTFCGTPQYFAPEVLKRRGTVAGQGRYGKQADMWSLGVILYVLLSGTPPFDAVGIDTVAHVKQIDFPTQFWFGISDSAKDLILKLLVHDPKRRLTVSGACEHPWILTHDGDTHVHPLHDPQLMAVSRKRLFSVSTDTATNLVDNKLNVATSAIPACEIECNPLCVLENERMLSFPANQNTIENGFLDICKATIESSLEKAAGSLSTTTGEHMNDMVVDCSNDENKNPNMLSLKDGVESLSNGSVATSLESKFMPEESPTQKMRDSRNPLSTLRCVNQEIRKVPDVVSGDEGGSPGLAFTIQQAKDKTRETDAEEALESVSKFQQSLQSNVIYASIKEVTPGIPKQKRYQADVDIVTPGVSNVNNEKCTPEGVRGGEFVAEAVNMGRQLVTNCMELYEDEIFSQFSEKTESICSFSTTTLSAVIDCETEVSSSSRDHDNNAKTKYANEDDQVARTSSVQQDAATSSKPLIKPNRRKRGKIASRTVQVVNDVTINVHPHGTRERRTRSNLQQRSDGVSIKQNISKTSASSDFFHKKSTISAESNETITSTGRKVTVVVVACNEEELVHDAATVNKAKAVCTKRNQHKNNNQTTTTTSKTKVAATAAATTTTRSMKTTNQHQAIQKQTTLSTWFKKH